MMSDAQNKIVAALLAAPEYVNPAIELAVRLQQAEAAGDTAAVDKAIRAGEMERAITDGEFDGRAVMNTMRACGHSFPIASAKVPVGF